MKIYGFLVFTLFSTMLDACTGQPTNRPASSGGYSAGRFLGQSVRSPSWNEDKSIDLLLKTFNPTTNIITAEVRIEKIVPSQIAVSVLRDTPVPADEKPLELPKPLPDGDRTKYAEAVKAYFNARQARFRRAHAQPDPDTRVWMPVTNWGTVDLGKGKGNG